MPYDPENPPDKLEGHGFTAKEKRQWVHVFNSCWESNPGDEAKCHAEAWGTVNKNKEDGEKKEKKKKKKSFNIKKIEKKAFLQIVESEILNEEKKINSLKTSSASNEKINKVRDHLEILSIVKSQIETNLSSPENQPDTDNTKSLPSSEEELGNILFKSVIDSFTTVLGDDNSPVFTVNTSEPNTIVVTYDPSKGGIEKDPFVFQNMDQFYKPVLTDIIGQIGVGVERPEEKKQELVDQIKDLLNLYLESLQTIEGKKKGKNQIIYKLDKESVQIVSKIYDILKSYNLAGPMTEKQNEDLSDVPQQMGEGTMGANKKPFNLKKKANKVFDTLREKRIQHEDRQYMTMHPKALPWYEDVYIEDYIWRNSIMDKYSPEKLDKEGEYRGGYIENRFHVTHNTEGNSLHVKLDKKTPDRIESYSTERRLEEMRKKDDRGYEQSEGEETKQQNKEVTASKKNVEVTEDHDLFRVRIGNKVAYMDTKSQVDLFIELASQMEEKDTKKKINAGINIVQKQPLLDDKAVISEIDRRIQSGEKTETVITNVITRLSAEGHNLSEIKRLRNEIFLKYGLQPTEHQGEEAPSEELASLMA